MTSAPVLDASDVDERISASAIITVVTLCFGGLSAALTQTMVIPIQGELSQLLGTSAANASWVITATLLTAAVTMPVAGRLGDMFGKQRVLVVSAGLLVVGSLVAALSSSLLPMLVGRAVQGMAMGFIPVGISLIREVTPPKLTATAIAAVSATLGVGGAIGLPLSAWIAQDFDWHVLFWTSAALALVVTLAVVVFVPAVNDAQGGRIDAVGVVGLAVGLVSVLVGVSKGNDWGWATGRTLGFLVVGVLVLLAWGFYELRQDEPLCDLRVTARRPVLLTNIAAVAVGFALMAQSIVVPQLLEMPTATGYGLGQSLLATGLWMAPAGLMMLVFAPVSSTLINRIGARGTLMIGAAVVGAGYIVAVFLMSAPWQLLIASVVSSSGIGIAYAAMPTLILGSVPLAEAGSAVGINGLMRSVGTSIASAAMVSLLTSSTFDLGGHAIPTQSAFRLCFVVGAVAAFVGVAITALVPTRQPSTSA
ncbi:MFS transporter [Spongisporangium articulatum]|uniref:MFS transporter n=1 Tax=Spongisporangium articulatum TaxID=3362603 RepID=A0ABW8AGH5_9ACTN